MVFDLSDCAIEIYRLDASGDFVATGLDCNGKGLFPRVRVPSPEHENAVGNVDGNGRISSVIASSLIPGSSTRAIKLDNKINRRRWSSVRVPRPLDTPLAALRYSRCNISLYFIPLFFVVERLATREFLMVASGHTAIVIACLSAFSLALSLSLWLLFLESRRNRNPSKLGVSLHRPTTVDEVFPSSSSFLLQASSTEETREIRRTRLAKVRNSLEYTKGKTASRKSA